MESTTEKQRDNIKLNDRLSKTALVQPVKSNCRAYTDFKGDQSFPLHCGDSVARICWIVIQM